MTRPRSGRSATFRLRVTPGELAALHRRGEAEGGYDWARAALLGDEVEVVEVGPGRPPRGCPHDGTQVHDLHSSTGGPVVRVEECHRCGARRTYGALDGPFGPWVPGGGE